jgi:hypothetical protein
MDNGLILEMEDASVGIWQLEKITLFGLLLVMILEMEVLFRNTPLEELINLSLESKDTEYQLLIQTLLPILL